MNIDTIVRAGGRPWLPNPSATGLEVWEANDAPTLGTFKMGNDTVLFASVTGVDRSIATWAYVGLDPVEAKELSDVSFPDQRAMWRHAEGLFADREIALAQSNDYVLDRMWMAVHCDGNLYKTALVFLEWVMQQMRDEVESVTGTRPDVVDLTSPTVSAWVESTYEHIEEAELQYHDVKRLVELH